MEANVSRVWIAFALFALLSGCMPRPQAATGVTVTPLLLKVGEAARPGETLTVQGRYLGGPATGHVRLGADEAGAGGYLIPADAILSWSDSKIVLRMPRGAPAGGGWLFVEVAGRRSTGLPYSVRP